MMRIVTITKSVCHYENIFFQNNNFYPKFSQMQASGSNDWWTTQPEHKRGASPYNSFARNGSGDAQDGNYNRATTTPVSNGGKKGAAVSTTPTGSLPVHAMSGKKGSPPQNRTPVDDPRFQNVADDPRFKPDTRSTRGAAAQNGNIVATNSSGTTNAGTYPHNNEPEPEDKDYSNLTNANHDPTQEVPYPAGNGWTWTFLPRHAKVPDQREVAGPNARKIYIETIAKGEDFQKRLVFHYGKASVNYNPPNFKPHPDSKVNLTK